jgi:glycosidase
MTKKSPAWLADAVLYQVYPQSFADSDGDGIGDLRGVIERLEYLEWLGVTAIWINPCFVSPFRDAGYDVADYLTVAPRYGTNDGVVALTAAARRHGIKVLLDLVPGHTSDQHPWFLASAADPADHRYIWKGTRPDGYVPNFFAFQPALNYGYARMDPGEPWRQPVDAEWPRANRAALREIMSFWLELGVAGFRADMAGTLVKDDQGNLETAALWAELRSWLDAAHPDAVVLTEWGDPAVSVAAGDLHADFMLQIGGRGSGLPFRSLFDNRHGTVDPRQEAVSCYFDAAGAGSARTFVEAYTAATAAIGEPGHIVLPTANHDFSRLCCGPRDASQLPAAFTFLLTWPTVPAVYYGDEIAMPYVPGLPDVEGSVLGPTYNRAGSRLPMRWDEVAALRSADGSLVNLVRRLISLRRSEPALGCYGSVEVLHDGYPLAYIRGGEYLVVVNPSGAEVSLAHRDPSLARAVPVENSGVLVTTDTITTSAFGYAVFRKELREDSAAQPGG